MEGTSNPASRKQACLNGISLLPPLSWQSPPWNGLRTCEYFKARHNIKDAIQSLMSGANSYVQCVVTVPYNLGGLPKLQKVIMYSRPSIALSFVAGSLLMKGKKSFAFIKILAEDTYQQHISCRSIFLRKHLLILIFSSF